MNKIMHIPTQHFPRRCSIHGFTLAELLITVAIIGILTSAALPSFREFIINQRIKTASFDLVSGLTFARSEAIKSNRQMALLPKAPFTLAYEEGWEVRADASLPLRKDQSGYPALTITCTGILCQGPIYTPDGRILNNNSGTFAISSSTIINPQIRCVSIKSTGQVFSKKGAC